MKMFNLSRLTAITLFAVTLLFSACNKDSFSEQNTEIKETVATLDVKIADNMMQFANMESFNETYAFVQNATVEELMDWQKQLGFSSVNDSYENVFVNFCCDFSEETMQVIRQQYEGLIKIDEENTIKPLVNAGNLGWMINKEGMFKVGKALIKYTNEFSISILDGDLQKMELAMQRPVTDEEAGIIVTQKEPSSFSRFCCSSLGISDSKTDNKKRIKTAEMTVADRSFVANVPVGIDGNGNIIYGTAFTIIYELDFFFHHQRKTFFGWTVCERTVWNYDADWNLIHNVPTTFGAPSSPIIGSVSNYITGNECKYNRTIGLIYAPFVPSSVYSSTGVTCADVLELDVTATNSGINVNPSCGF